MEEGVWMEEGMGESSSPPRGSGGGLHEIKSEIYARLLQSRNEEVISNPDFRDLLDAHFSRLPASYGLDLSVDRAEDVLMHWKLLAKAKDPVKRLAFHVRLMKLEDLDLDMTMEAEDIEDGRCFTEALSARRDVSHVTIHEIIFSTVDKPKLLCQLSALLSDIGLNIREAHVFSTTDGYSLVVFAVDGWPTEDTDGLQEEIEAGIARNEGSWSGSSHSSAAEKSLVVPPKIGYWEINTKMLKMKEMIGSGSSGDLYRGSYLGQEVAIKVFRPEHLTDAQGIEFAQEVMILREVQHRNVVQFVGACTKPPHLCIVTEYMPDGNLYDFLHKYHNILGLSMFLKFALDICKGMEYLHQNNIIHRDLKTANLLMDRDHVVRVADFGVARFQNQGVMTAETGTYRWMAPEVINHQPYDQKADVFSFAIVLWELATSKIPYDTLTPLQAAVGVRQGLRPELPVNMHPRLCTLMQRCWETVPARRPSFTEIVMEVEEFIKQNIQEIGETNNQEKIYSG